MLIDCELVQNKTALCLLLKTFRQDAPAGRPLPLLVPEQHGNKEKKGATGKTYYFQ